MRRYNRAFGRLPSRATRLEVVQEVAFPEADSSLKEADETLEVADFALYEAD